MGYVDKHLGADEAVVFRTRLHPVIFAGAATFSAFVIGVVLLIVRRNQLAGETVLTLSLIGAAIVVVSLASPYIRWQTSEFAVTSRRVIVKLGLLWVHTVELLIPNIETVTVDQSIWGRLLGYGTLRIAGTEGTVEAFARVSRPTALREAVLRRARR